MTVVTAWILPALAGLVPAVMVTAVWVPMVPSQAGTRRLVAQEVQEVQAMASVTVRVIQLRSMRAVVPVDHMAALGLETMQTVEQVELAAVVLVG